MCPPLPLLLVRLRIITQLYIQISGASFRASFTLPLLYALLCLLLSDEAKYTFK